MEKRKHSKAKLCKKLASVLDRNQWRINNIEKCGDGTYDIEIENWTSGGQDVVETINVNGLKDESSISDALYRLYEDYDVSDNVRMFLEAKDNGLSGVPDVVGLVDDVREVERMLKTLYDDFCEYELNERNPFRGIVRKLNDDYSELRKASSEYVKDAVAVAVSILKGCEGNEIDFTERDFNTPALINGGVTDIISMCKDGTDAVLTYDDDEEHDIMLSELEPSELDTVIGCMMEAYDYLKEHGGDKD